MIQDDTFKRLILSWFVLAVLACIYSLSLQLIVHIVCTVCAFLNEDAQLAHYSMILCDQTWYFLLSYHHSVKGFFIICFIAPCTPIFGRTYSHTVHRQLDLNPGPSVPSAQTNLLIQLILSSMTKTTILTEIIFCDFHLKLEVADELR